jgi:transglutaminase-like putative cysteine protease
MSSTTKEKKHSSAAKHSLKPENSIAIRIVCGLMAMLCLGAACVYTRMQPMLTFFFLWATFAGSYVSYFTRRQRNIMAVLVSFIGVSVLLGFFLLELYNDFVNGQTFFLIPFIHVLGGLLALHTLELRTRADLELNCLIAFGVLCCTMVLGRDLTFGILCIMYIWLASIFFYLDTRSRAREKGRLTPTESTDSPLTNKAGSYASVAIILSSLPLTALAIFLCLPRMNSVFDTAADYLNEAMAQQTLMPGPRLQNTAQPGAGSLGTRPGGSSATGSRTRASATAAHSNQMAGSGTQSGPPQDEPGGGGTTARKGTGTPGKGKKGAAAKGKREPVPDKGPPEDQLIMRNKEAQKYDDELLFEAEVTGDYFYRRQILTKYDGQAWTVGPPNVIAKCKKLGDDHYQELGGVSSLFVPSTVPTTPVVLKITVQSHLGRIIPVVSVPQKVAFPSEPLTVDDLGVVRAPKDLVAGTTYELVCQVPKINLEELRKASETPEDEKKTQSAYPECLALPANLPEEVSSLARQRAGADGNWFVKCERLCKFLRTTYKYSDTGDDIPPGKRDLVDYFLFTKKSGACGPFASAFAVMCRSLGIPARVIGGFAPGDLNGMNGLREVHGRHGHAWVETYIPNSGWVPFDATPGGTLPAPLERDTSLLAAFTRNLAEMQATLHGIRKPDQPSSPVSKDTNATTSSQMPPLPNGKDSGTAKGNKTQPTGPLGVDIKDLPKTALSWLLRGLLVVGLIPLTILLIQAIMEAREKFKSKWGAFKDAKHSTILYLKVLEDLKRYKVPRQPCDTAEDLAGRFSLAIESGLEVHPEFLQTLKTFMEMYSDDRFGRAAGGEERTKEMEQLGEKIHALASRRV